ncbi:hypothetical protein L1049_003309 [Liquidambar formosana]|uniref:C3H1-type domain-containing protein n=1 Tax=Liquidambar formosana TaxID=63359 RepID=A0AAP0NK20_LIQFO
MYPEKTMYPHSALAVNNLMKKTYVPTHTQQIQVEEFPERPGQSECDYFMKTGDCKYRSACRYHHPKTRSSKLSFCVVSDKGLPLRPGRKICWHYEQYGICKYGHACLFDHPVNHDSSAFAIGSALEPSSGTNAASIGSY